jgi:hypothetical protein
MRELTDLFINRIGSVAGSYIKEEEVDERHGSYAIVEYGDKSLAIYRYVLSLPSAQEEGHPSSNDWVYEACRITAIIYTEAIVALEQFSKVGDINYSRGSFTSAHWSSRTCTKSLPEKLYEALEHTDIASVWGDMAGVLYWVCAVGAAAARTPVGSNSGSESIVCERQQYYPVWVQRCLAMTATRTMIILVSKHPTPMVIAQRRLYEVQELIRAS